MLEFHTYKNNITCKPVRITEIWYGENIHPSYIEHYITFPHTREQRPAECWTRLWWQEIAWEMFLLSRTNFPRDHIYLDKPNKIWVGRHHQVLRACIKLNEEKRSHSPFQRHYPVCRGGKLFQDSVSDWLNLLCGLTYILVRFTALGNLCQ